MTFQAKKGFTTEMLKGEDLAPNIGLAVVINDDAAFLTLFPGSYQSQISGKMKLNF